MTLGESPGDGVVLAGHDREDVRGEIPVVPLVAERRGTAVDEGAVERSVLSDHLLPLALGPGEVVRVLPEGVDARLDVPLIDLGAEALEPGGHLVVQRGEGRDHVLGEEVVDLTVGGDEQRAVLRRDRGTVQATEHFAHLRCDAGGLAGDQDHVVVQAQAVDDLDELGGRRVGSALLATAARQGAVDVEEGEVARAQGEAGQKCGHDGVSSGGWIRGVGARRHSR